MVFMPRARFSSANHSFGACMFAPGSAKPITTTLASKAGIGDLKTLSENGTLLERGETTGAVDLTIDRRNPDVIIASLNHHVTYPWDEESGGVTTGLFRTTDGGDSWTDITRNPGMPTGLIGKIGVAISPARSSRVYAFVEAAAGDDGLPGIDPCRL